MEEKRSNYEQIASSSKAAGKYKEGNPQAADKSEHHLRTKGNKKHSKRAKHGTTPTAQTSKTKKRKGGDKSLSKSRKRLKRQESLSDSSQTSSDPPEEEVKLEKESDSCVESK